MKKIFFALTLVLAMIFAPFVFAASIGEAVIELPSFLVPGLDADIPLIGANCRDVSVIQSNTVILLNQQAYTLIESVDYSALIKTSPVEPVTRREAAYQTDRTVLLMPRVAQTQTEKRGLGQLIG